MILLIQLQEKLSPHCLSFTQKDAAFYESAALAEEACLQQYLETEQISDDLLRTAIANRTLFPCWFGSALKQQGIADFLICWTNTLQLFRSNLHLVQKCIRLQKMNPATA